MIKQYLKQAIETLRENRLTSVISILGTALSVAMILVIVLQFQIKQFGYSPVSNRGRMLYVYNTHVSSKDGKESNNTGLSVEALKACFYSLKTPEMVTAISNNKHAVSLPGKRLFDEYSVCYTDPGYWSVFNYRFLAGKPFTEADFQSELPRVVISDYLAGRVFGSTDVVGRELVMNNVLNCMVAGVVERPSEAAYEAFSDLWIPYSANSSYLTSQYCEGIGGGFSVMLLTSSLTDLPAIKAELQKAVGNYNAGKTEFVMSAPELLTNLDVTLGSNGRNQVGWSDYFRKNGLVLLFLLLVPVLNLTGVVQSSIKKRRSEIGLRKAFGASRGRLFVQLISENLVITAIGGVIGIALSILILQTGKPYLLSKEMVLTAAMLFKPLLFAAALVLTLLLNLLSAGIPAWRITRSPIVESLKDEDAY